MPFPMPCNIKTKGFLHYYKGALVFCSQKPRFRKKIGQLAVQIIDAQSLQIVEKIVNNSSHGVEILTTSSLAAGKDLTLTEACNAVASMMIHIAGLFLKRISIAGGYSLLVAGLACAVTS